MRHLESATEHVIWTEEQWDCFHFSNESKFNLFSFDWRRFVPRNPKERYPPQCTKRSVKVGGGSVVVLGMIYVLEYDLLSRYTAKLSQIVYKEILKNMLYLIWELQLINQLYLCKITLRVMQRSMLRRFPLRRVLLLWSGLHKSYWECLEVIK